MSTPRLSALALLLVCLPVALAACGSDNGPTATPTPVIAVFHDPNSTFSTSQVRDVDDQLMRFSTVSGSSSLVWLATGQSFGGWQVSGNFLDSAKKFEVLFGIVNGERRAYFTDAATATICDLDVDAGGNLTISPTSTTVPK